METVGFGRYAAGGSFEPEVPLSKYAHTIGLVFIFNYFSRCFNLLRHWLDPKISKYENTGNLKGESFQVPSKLGFTKKNIIRSRSYFAHKLWNPFFDVQYKSKLI